MSKSPQILFKKTRKSRKEKVNFRFNKSPNKDYILISSYILKDENIDFNFIIFDNNYKKLQENSYAISSLNESFLTFNIDNYGNYYCLNQSVKSKRKTVIASKLNLNHFSLKGELLSKTTLPNKNIYNKNLKLTNMDNGNVLISSIPNSKGKINYPFINTGIYTCMFSPINKEVVNQELNKLSDEFIKKYLNKESFKDKQRALVGLGGLSDYVETENGFYFIDEYKYTSFQSTPTINVTSYYFSNISVFFFDKNGKMKWQSVVNKSQVESKASPKFGASTGAISGSLAIGKFGKNQTQFYSYCYIFKGNNLALIYNDNPKNLDLKKGKRPRILKNIKKGVPVMLSFNDKGEQKKELLVKNQEVILAPKVFLNIKENTYLLYSEKKKVKKLVYLTF
jgi:hypothetical protein